MGRLLPSVPTLRKDHAPRQHVARGRPDAPKVGTRQRRPPPNRVVAATVEQKRARRLAEPRILPTQVHERLPQDRPRDPLRPRVEHRSGVLDPKRRRDHVSDPPG
jgi:hypothetical protein